jgi:hypothetical protein
MGKRHQKSVEASMIIGLHFSSSPSAIPWLVIAIVIYAVYREFGAGTWSHVGQKVLKFFPSLTNFYSSSSIVMPFFGLGISATKTHGIPYSIFGSLFPMFGATMFQWSLPACAPFLCQASTTLCISALEGTTGDNKQSTAGASTLPNGLAMAIYESEG